MNITVNVSDARISSDTQDVITTYALGSCIGVACYDPVSRVAGMLHYQLPSSTIDVQRAREKPLMFADTGMDMLLREMTAAGAQKKRLRIKIAGAAQMLNDNNLFSIGRRNHAAIRKVLWQHGLFIDAEDVGGTHPRNMQLAVADGAVTIKVVGEKVSI